MSEAKNACIHCDTPIPASRGEDPFCCPGCAAAHAWISQAGLDHFYQIKDQDGARAWTPLSDQTPNFAHFDDPDYLESLGLTPGDSVLRVVGLHCAACVWLLEQLPKRLDGLSSLRVNWESQSTHLRWDPETLKLSHIAQVIHTLGYRLVAADQGAQNQVDGARRQELIRLAITGASAGNVMLVTLALYSGELSDMGSDFQRLFEAFAAFFALPCLLYGAVPFYRAAWASLRLRRLHLDVPIACGVIVGYGFALLSLFRGGGDLYFDTISILVFLLLLGRRLQDESRRWAFSQAGALNVLLPASTVVQRDGVWQNLSRLQLRDQDLVRVDPQRKVPADGDCVDGQSHVDARSLTGESHPLPVGPGTAVLAGTINVGAAFTMKVRARNEATRLGRVARSLTFAPQHKVSVRRAIDRVSGAFSWIVLTSATVSAITWFYLSGTQKALDVFLATLIISCPCALGLATPLALALARAKAARSGILVAHDAALEDLAKINAIAFDKTGTLTCGELEVVHCETELDERTLRSQIAALEQSATHPIARSLVRWAQSTPADTEIEAIQEVPSQGINAVKHRTRIRLGRFRDVKFRKAVQAWHQIHPEVAPSTVYLTYDDRVVAALGLQDRLRHGARSWIAQLRAQGYDLMILSGDTRASVQNIGRALGILQVMHDKSPEAKLEALQDRPWAMIGDGINDAVALRGATVGIAVGQNAEIAAKVADIYVMRPGIDVLSNIFRLSKQTQRTIRRNLTFALIYNLVFAVAACTGHIRPLVAAILMPLSSLTVLLNSWWSLGRFKKNAQTRPEPSLGPPVSLP